MIYWTINLNNHLKQKIIYFFIKIAVILGDFLVFLGHGLAIFVRNIGRSSKKIFVFFLPILIFFYKNLYSTKQKIIRLLAPAQKRFYLLLANRFFVHLLVFFLVALSSTFCVWAEENPSLKNSSSLLAQVFSLNEETIQDDQFPNKLLANEDYFFLDMPIEELDPDLPELLPGGGIAKVETSPFVIAPTRSQIFEYTVEPGDTVSTIAQRFNVSVNTILWENNLTPYSLIKPGQKLRILPVSGVSHQIKQGETLDKIAKRYGVTKEEILQFNSIDDETKLTLNQTLVIPNGVPPTPSWSTPSRPPRIQPQEPPSPSRIEARSPSLEGDFIWPTTANRLTQYFSWRHPAVDIAGPKGSPVFASASGVVVLVEKKYTGYGWQIMLDHENGAKTRYAHLSEIYVQNGQRVKKGEVIGLLGSTGRSTGPHLHFELYFFNRRINPLNFLKR